MGHVTPESDPSRHLAGALRDRHALLLIENVEHVAAAAPHITELLLACPRMKALARSSSALWPA